MNRFSSVLFIEQSVYKRIVYVSGGTVLPILRRNLRLSGYHFTLRIFRCINGGHY